MNKLRVFEAFAGVGSQSMALRNIGCNYEVVGISDVDKNALIAYDAIHNNNEEIELRTKEEMLYEIKSKNIAYNFSTGKSEIPRKEEDIRKLYNAHIRNKNFGDIRLINPQSLPDFDFFTYSFPCKNISVAGMQGGLEEGSGTQSSLVWECKKIIENKKPKYLMMENVKNIIGKKHKATLDAWCSDLEKIGYKNYYKLLDGQDFGVAQRRERVIMVSILGEDKFDIPITNNKKSKLIDILEKQVDDKYFLDYPWHYIQEGEKRDCQNTIANIETISYSRTRAVMDINKVCQTIDAMQGGQRWPKILDENENLRRLTPLECWRIMGFSDHDFYKAQKMDISESKLYERAGRGIVVPMLEEIFKNLFKEYISED